MAIERTSPNSVERRCPNCGTRVARDAESCFMCGHDLRVTPRRAQRVSLVDALLVLAVVAVLVLWWQVGNRPQSTAENANAAIAPGNVPLITGTILPTTTPEPTPTLTPLPATTTYVRHQVLTGETLLSIAADYAVTVEELQAVNNLQDALIRAGDTLIIPVLQEGGAALALSEGTEARFQYTVRTGDTIISIAVNFGSTVEEILRINNLTPNDIIRPGDQLTIPLRQTPSEVLESAASAVVEAPTVAAIGAANESATTIYIEPRLVGPADGSRVVRTDELLFRWISVDVLQPNEWYVLLIYPEAGVTHAFPSIWTKATSYRIAPEFAPPTGQSASYSWQVSLIRVNTSADGQLLLEAASPASAVRQFTWE